MRTSRRLGCHVRSAWFVIPWLLVCVLVFPARGQCPTLVYSEDFESGGAGWSVTGDWLIGPGTACGEPCVQGIVGTLPANFGLCQCDNNVGPPPVLDCDGDLASPWIPLPDLSPGEQLSLSYCADLFMVWGCDFGVQSCHRLQVRSCGGGAELYYIGGYGPFNTPCVPVFDEPPFDLSSYAGQCVQLTFSAGCVGEDGGRSRFQVDNVEILRLPPAPVVYCSSALNSTGMSASISSSGCTSLAQNAFDLTASDCPPGQIGLFFFGPDQAHVVFGNGLLCVAGTVARLVPASAISASGVATKWVDNAASPAAGKLIPGSTWNFQFWFRDPAAGGSNFNLSDGLSAHFVP